MKKHLQWICLYLILGIGYSSAQDTKVTGKVKDQNGNALPGVNIVVSGTLQGTATDAVGDFTISVPATGALTFSFIGYQNQTVQVNKRTAIEVTLEEDLKNLTEVVVVGYGTQSKAKISDAISTIKMDNVLRDRPVSNLGAALEGTIPGMSVSIGSGQPGTKPSFNIRGYTSLNGGDPLFVVDNMPIDDISGLNPSDIETVSVLKDAASSVLYGARAAFGVILITTKKGKFNQPTSFEYAAGYSPTRVSTMPKKLNVREWVNVMESIGQTQWWSGQNIAKYKSLLDQYEANPSQFPANGIAKEEVNYSLRTYNQFADFFEGGQQQYHSFTASGGSSNLSFRSSVRFDNEDGAIVGPNDKYKKWTTNNTITAQLTPKVNFSANIFYNNFNKREPADLGFPFYAMVTQPSFAPTGYDSVMTEIGMQYLPRGTKNNTVQLQNPRIKYGDQLRLSSKLNFEPVRNLLITGEYTFERTAENETRSDNNSVIRMFHPEYLTYTPLDPNAQSYTSYYKNNNLKNNQILNAFGKYTFDQLADHHLELMVGTNQEYVTYEKASVSREGLLSLDAPAINTATGPITGGDEYWRYAVSGYFGQIQYDYQNKYMLKLNARYDGSSRFPKDSRYGFFPSGSIAWNLMNESFTTPLEGIFNTLKLRASYGSIGNQVIKDVYYPAIATMDVNNNAGWLNPTVNLPFNGVSTPGLISKNLTWETVTTLGGGLDGTALRNRLNFSFDLFKRTTSGMMVSGKPLPAILGTSAPRSNAADMESKGFELSIGWSDQIGNVRYNISANLANDKAYITKFDNPSGTLDNYYVGQRRGEVWGFVSDRLYQVSDFEDGTLNSSLTGGKLKSGIPYYEGASPNPGDMMYKNLDGDKKVDGEGNSLLNWGEYTVSNPGDRKIIGNESHQYRFGVTGGLDFKGFDFSFILNGIGKRQRDVNNAFFRPWQNQYFDILAASTDFWTVNNTDAHYARVYPQAGGNAWLGGNAQTRYLRSWAYLRVKNIALGYTFPEGFSKRLALKKVRLFVSGENLFTIDALPDGIDPGADDLGSGAMYPYLKKFNMGINVNF
ncbi:SusC/RagA family TonB-linked outer membrane protein [Dyadobacter sp. CY312]|uniref:SusC/RagA family TonB-linked outer membrane protein n=1 Tax=Dyadobacter sp. CY312 TaxID=2907303 RepID=UPI001F1C1B69|nr:SusC/RagA family TonB-linked outer membrane protein [Dyadobacter sp. CY312]MCE7044252.1 SusC/RagA family TonB-linked outer membrane protein [Dyadobacter sp. CY312]